MELQVDEVNRSVRCVRLSGRLDAPNAERIGLPFTASVSVPDRHAVIDLSGVEFIASMGIRLLIECARSVRARGQRIAIFGAQDLVASVLTEAAIDQIIPLVATRDDALALVEHGT